MMHFGINPAKLFFSEKNAAKFFAMNDYQIFYSIKIFKIERDLF